MSSTLVALLDNVSGPQCGPELVLATVPGYQGGSHSVGLSGSFVGTVALEGSIDGKQWFLLSTWRQPGLIAVNGVFWGLRGRVTFYARGSVNMQLRYGQAAGAAKEER